MSSFRTVVALVAVASLAANVYLANKLWAECGKAETRTYTMDEPLVMRTKGGLLEVSRILATEHFESSQSHTILGVPVGNTITHIRVPAVYRYHIELAPEWRIILRDKTFIVIAPPVKPTLPVAIDTALLASYSSGAWSIFTGHTLLNQLQRSITQALALRAITPNYVQIQRETARKTVAEFVAKWLITQARWKAFSSYPVRVFFSDEPIQVMGNIAPLFVGAR